MLGWFKRPKLIWHVPQGRNDLIPQRSTPGAMAFDIVSPTEHFVSPGTSALINTLVAATIPKGYALVLRSRSGLAAKNHIVVEAGEIDNDYTGLIKVLLRCHGSASDYHIIKPGDRIAQARLVKIHDIETHVSFEYPDANRTKRGSGGFGSTGR